MSDYIVRSLTISEILGDDGRRYITMTETGDPTAWDLMGLLDYALTATAQLARWPTNDEEPT